MRETEVHLKWAQTLDGQLCDDDNRSQWISGKEERAFTHAIRTRFDGIAVGVSTYLIDRAQLTVREGFESAIPRQPSRIIVDPRGKLAKLLERCDPPLREQILRDLHSEIRTTYLVGRTANLAPYLRPSFRAIEADLDFESPKFKENLLAAIGEIPPRGESGKFRLLIEGGPRLIKQCLDSEIGDEFYVSIAPILTGGKRHRIDLSRLLANALTFEVAERFPAGPDTVLRLRRRVSSEKGISSP